MMKKKRFLFLLLAIIAVALGLAFALHYINRPAENVADMAAVAEIQADSLYATYLSQERRGDSLYLNKILIVTGTVQQKGRSGPHFFIILSTGGQGGINCEINSADSSEVANITTHQPVKIKGRCTGFLVDVNLTDGVLIK